jgi:O-antigen ligase
MFLAMKIIEKIYNHFDFVILTGITVLFLPFVGTSLTIDPVLTLRFCIWGIMTFILLTSFVINLCNVPNTIDCNIIKRIIFLAFLGYLLFTFISLTKAINVTEGIYEVLKLSLSIIYLFLATVILSKNNNYIPILIKTIIVAASALSLIGFYEYFRYDIGSPGPYAITGTMAQRNQFSSALFLMLSFCFYAVLEFRVKWKIISTIILMLVLIFLNQTRSVWLGMFTATVITVTVVWLMFIFGKLSISKETKAYFLKRFIYILIVIVIAGTVFGYLYLRTNSISSLEIGSIFSPTHNNNAMRLAMWQQTLELVQDNPLCGVGAGNWKIILPSYGTANFPNRWIFKKVYYVRPENDYLWVLSEIGILGFISYLAIFAIAIFYIIKIIIHTSDLSDKLLSILLLFGLTGYMVISFFSFPKERIFHSIFLLLMMAIVISIYNQLFKHKKNISRSLMFALTVPSLFILLSVIADGYVRVRAEVFTKRALVARKAVNWPMIITEIDKGYSAFATLDPMSTPLQWYRGEANYSLNNIPQALEDFKKAYNANPYHIHVLNNLATCYEMQSDHNRAILYYKKALEIYPEFKDALINLGATYYNTGKYEQAYQTLLLCKPNTQNLRLQQYLKSVKEKLDKE